MRVVLHAPTADALTRARSNARNLRASAPDNEILILANADAVPAALAAPDPDTDACLRLCGNTLTARGLTAPPEFETVPAVIAELVRLQSEDWFYVRA